MSDVTKEEVKSVISWLESGGPIPGVDQSVLAIARSWLAQREILEEVALRRWCHKEDMYAATSKPVCGACLTCRARALLDGGK